ncbi:MAG: exonuclease SbcCD subunit D [Acutalibacteraceae bacterium]
MKIKIAHCSDVHIGASALSLGDRSHERRNEIKNSFFKIINKCELENVQLLCVAGDLFDNTDVLLSEVEEVKNICEKAPFKIVISPGNHDPFTADSPYNSIWPENVHIFKKNNLESIEFPQLNLRVWGAAFTGRYERKSFLENFNFLKDDFVNICVLHAEISDMKKIYNPITISEIGNSGMDYMALGHIHKRSEICKSADTFYAYSGSPESLGFDEPGDKGFYLGYVDKNFCSMNFEKISSRKYITSEIDISDCDNENDVKNVVINYLNDKYENYSENIYKLTLVGETKENLYIDAKNLESLLKEFVFYCVVVDNTFEKIDIEKLKYRTDFRSLFIKDILHKIENESDEIQVRLLKNALKLGLKAFESDVKYSEN